MFQVTRPFLPDKDRYKSYVDKIWDSQVLTNNGQFVQELQEKISGLTGSEPILMTNGTLPLQIAIKSISEKLEGNAKIITTPFSYIATSSSILWEGCIPVFVDIDPINLTVDPSNIETAIDDCTIGILATHVFGNPCDVVRIAEIARKHNLAVIYDAAHCFGVKYLGKDIFTYGDYSTVSFHATKVFHTGEGGALFSNSEESFNKAFYRHNFGHNGPHDFYGVGINAKMSEFQAIMGLCVLERFNEIVNRRRQICELYDSLLNGSRMKRFNYREGTIRNYAYYPVILNSETELLNLLEGLKVFDIFPRRYFYPSLDEIDFTQSKRECNFSQSIASRIICLPLYNELNNDEVIFIANKVNHLLS